MRERFSSVYIPAFVAVGSFRENDNEPLLLSEIIENAGAIHCIGGATAPVDGCDDGWIGGEICWDIDPGAHICRIRAIVGSNLREGGAWDVHGWTRRCRAGCAR